MVTRRMSWISGSRRYLLGAFGGALAIMAAAAQASEPCDGIIPERGALERDRPVSVQDLVRLRDIGYSFVAPGHRLVAVSPDRTHVAFAIHRADPDANAYCQAILIMPIRSNSQATVLDQSDEIIMQPYSIRGVQVAYGYPTVVLPAWSPDGQWIAYLKRENGRTQVWRVRAEGGSPQQITHANVDVDLFDWSADGKAIIYGSRPSIVEAKAAIEREGRVGFLYDDRVVPYSSSRPAVSGSLPYERTAIDLATGTERALSASDIEALPLPGSPDPAEQMRLATTADGRRAWTVRRDTAQYFSPVELRATLADGREARCDHASCNGGMSFDFPGLWWTPDGRELVFLRREGRSNSALGVYRWRPGAGHPRRMLTTDDLLIGCELLDEDLLCAREGSTTPRRLELINARTGASRVLFDPNPEIGARRLGRVERLYWRNELGIETYGDLVLPPDYERGQKLPLVIVQYTTQGFLRGGSGDESPIQAFAARGYAVLSFQRPSLRALQPTEGSSLEESIAADSHEWRERRVIHASLMSGLRLLIDRGIVDETRIGITGHSDGSTTTQFALINAPGVFKAAAIGSCCSDPTSFMIYGGTGLAAERRAWGFPEPRGKGLEAWRPLSLAMNADAIDTPLLMQVADHEYLVGIDTFMSLRDAGKPVEMYIFPEEYHLKWQPAHRLAIYQRNLAWMDFWLRDQVHPELASSAEYERWSALRRSRADANARPLTSSGE